MVKGVYSVKKRQIVFTPEKPLQYSAEYKIRLTRKIKDITGKGLKKQIQWGFKTRVKIDYPEADDPNILIFSPSHEPVSWVKEKQGVLKIGITAFDPILQVDINGNIIGFKKDTQIQFELPYILKARTTQFEITTFTRVGKSKKKFVINVGKKPKPRKALLLVGIVGLTSTDNVNNSPSNKGERYKIDINHCSSI